MKVGDTLKRKNLIKWHIDNDVSYKDVYEYVGCGKNHYSLLINGNANPSFGLIEKFEEFCNQRKIIIDDMWEIWKKSN